MLHFFKIKFLKNEKIYWRYHHFQHVYHKSNLYDVWFLWDGVRETECFVILGHFLPFYPLNDPENQNFEKKIKKCLEILSFYTYTWTINEDHMMYIWFLKYKVRETKFFVILSHFLPFQPPDNSENQNFEKMKKHLQILSFYTLAPWMTIIWCMVPELWSATDRIFCHSGLFFLPFYPLMDPENQNFEKMKKPPDDIIILQMCT